MLASRAVRGAVLIVIALASPALAAPRSDDVSPTTFHKRQLGISARFGLGLRALATNENTTYCGQEDSTAAHGLATLCTGRSPLVFGLEAAYGVANSIELLVDLELGLEKDFGSAPGASDAPRLTRLAPGARFFFSEARHAKLFVEPLAVFDFTGYKDKSFDFGLSAREGLWIDLHRTYGFYFYVGEVLEFARFAQKPAPPASRWLDFELVGGVGFQGRYP